MKTWCEQRKIHIHTAMREQWLYFEIKIKITNQNKRKSDVNSSVVFASFFFFLEKYKQKKQLVKISDETFKYTNQIANQNFVSQCEKKKLFFFFPCFALFFFFLLFSLFSVCCNTHSIHVVLLWTYAKHFVYIKRIDFSCDSAEWLCYTPVMLLFFSASSLLSLWLWLFIFFFYLWEYLLWCFATQTVKPLLDWQRLTTYTHTNIYLCTSKTMTFYHVFHVHSIFRYGSHDHYSMRLNFIF